MPRNISRQKGSAGETAAVEALRRLLCHDKDTLGRRKEEGAYDRGDVQGVQRIVFEVKNVAKKDPWGWLTETAVETRNAKADFGILIVKPEGVGLPNGEKFASLMYADDARMLMAAANMPRIRRVELRRSGWNASWAELLERERHCGGIPVEIVQAHRDRSKHLSLMRLDARCDLLRRAGYSACDMMSLEVSPTS